MSNEIPRKASHIQIPRRDPQVDNGDWAITPSGQVIHPSEMTDEDWEKLEFDLQYRREDFEYENR